jgi:hypothetical protein
MDSPTVARDGDSSPVRTHAWHAIPAEEALSVLDSDRAGLSAAEAASRLETYGANVLPEGEKRTLGHMVLDQFKDFLILLLIGAAVIVRTARRGHGHRRHRSDRPAQCRDRRRTGVSCRARDGGPARDGRDARVGQARR